MRKSDRSADPVLIEGVTVKRATEKAILIKTKEGEETWIPRSQINEYPDHDELSDIADVGDEGNLILPRWLAEDKELTYDEIER